MINPLRNNNLPFTVQWYSVRFVISSFSFPPYLLCLILNLKNYLLILYLFLYIDTTDSQSHYNHQECFHGTCMQVLYLNLLISSAIQLQLFCKLFETCLDVILKAYQTLHQNKKSPWLWAVSLPCRHDVRPYIMVTRFQLEEEGFLLSFKKTQRQKIDTVALADLKTGLGERGSGTGFSSEEEKKRIGLKRIFDPPTTDSPKPSFFFSFQLSHWSNIMNCTVRLVEIQAAELNQVNKKYEKVWLATKFLLFGRVVLVLLSFCDWQVFYSHHQSDHNIKKEYQGHEMVTIADMSYDNFKAKHKSSTPSMNHLIFLMIIHILLKFKFNFKKNLMRKRYLRNI
ncbi:hypothetical protein VP01_67g2 [Puccinia sorghi]|uniref:Uncharacterized protein n=1 Tax=Puccinia sorghi TaxID=27349 RepID=A0A0L6UEL8_9BASI|nr:hypothetical protein VP01_67g2 [Puccinia sorghi]